MKRTTLILEDAVWKAVRKLAESEDRTLSDVVNALIIEGLGRRVKPNSKKFKLPSFRMGKPGVHLGDRDALEALMDS